MTKIDSLLIDVGTGNLHSVDNALKKIGYNVQITSNPADLSRPARIVLPGVGAFAEFMSGVHKRGLFDALLQAVKRGDPVLGICVGMQAFFDVSEEMGSHLGLGLLAGRVKRFPEFTDLKVPHTGWNQLWPVTNQPLFNKITPGSYTYFNHSYYCAPDNPQVVAANTDYGFQFCSVIQYENLFGVQFHPEKSQLVGQQILKNFFST